MNANSFTLLMQSCLDCKKNLLFIQTKVIVVRVFHKSSVISVFTFSVFMLTDTNKLCIVMELIEGAPIGEHFHSLKEKKETFAECRIWNIFIQIVLALRYLHKEKHIVHRDLTPNNIMLSENDRVTISKLTCSRLCMHHRYIYCVTADSKNGYLRQYTYDLLTFVTLF